MKALLLTAGSLLLTGCVVANAYYRKQQFYPSVVYITKSSPSMAVLYIQAFVCVILMGKLMRKIFFGQLRAAEMEHLIERSWYAVTETCLAFTVFRDDFSPRFVGLFTLLLFLKCFHWLAEDRVEYMERSPIISILFHIRAITLLLVLGSLDLYFINHAYYSTLIKGASVQLVFGFEYAILATVVVTIFVKYILHSVDLQSENPWENKAVYMLYTDLVLGCIRVILYMLFLAIMIKVHTFPLFAIRPMYLTMRAFKKALNDVIMSRRAIRNMNTLYPDATLEELQAGDNVCIICREEMLAASKKLPCNHIFHTSCLRSWFQRQQTCPTCRMDVLRNPNGRPPPTPVPQQQPQNVQPIPPAQPQGFQGFPAGFPMWPPQPPQAPPASSSTTSSQPATSTTNTATTSAPGVTRPGMPPGAMPDNGSQFMMPPFWMMPGMMPFSVPPPMPAADFRGFTTEEMRKMEGHERENIETRIQCLRNIQTLLDAAVISMQQYTTIVNNIGNPPPASTSTQNTATNAEAPSSSPTSSIPTSTTANNTTDLKSSSQENSSQNNDSLKKAPEQLDIDNELEGAVGFTPPETQTIPEWDGLENDSKNDKEIDEVRKRRLERFDSTN